MCRTGRIILRTFILRCCGLHGLHFHSEQKQLGRKQCRSRRLKKRIFPLYLINSLIPPDDAMRRSTTSGHCHTITRKIQRWRPPESSPQERHTVYGIPQRLQMLHLARGARYRVTGVSCSGSSGVAMTVLRPAHIIWYLEIVPLSKWRCKLSICCSTIEKSIPLHDTDSWFARMKRRRQSSLVLSH